MNARNSWLKSLTALIYLQNLLIYFTMQFLILENHKNSSKYGTFTIVFIMLLRMAAYLLRSFIIINLFLISWWNLCHGGGTTFDIRAATLLHIRSRLYFHLWWFWFLMVWTIGLLGRTQAILFSNNFGILCFYWFFWSFNILMWIRF